MNITVERLMNRAAEHLLGQGNGGALQSRQIEALAVAVAEILDEQQTLIDNMEFRLSQVEFGGEEDEC